jgi:hypothetical protein
MFVAEPCDLTFNWHLISVVLRHFIVDVASHLYTVSVWQCCRRFERTCFLHIVTCIPIARERLGKNIPAKRTRTAEGHPLFGTDHKENTASVVKESVYWSVA